VMFRAKQLRFTTQCLQLYELLGCWVIIISRGGALAAQI
jgi:hypothetical protein